MKTNKLRQGKTQNYVNIRNTLYSFIFIMQSAVKTQKINTTLFYALF